MKRPATFWPKPVREGRLAHCRSSAKGYSPGWVETSLNRPSGRPASVAVGSRYGQMSHGLGRRCLRCLRGISATDRHTPLSRSVDPDLRRPFGSGWWSGSPIWPVGGPADRQSPRHRRCRCICPGRAYRRRCSHYPCKFFSRPDCGRGHQSEEALASRQPSLSAWSGQCHRPGYIAFTHTPRPTSLRSDHRPRQSMYRSNGNLVVVVKR
jgi:hypothetical protein